MSQIGKSGFTSLMCVVFWVMLRLWCMLRLVMGDTTGSSSRTKCGQLVFDIAELFAIAVQHVSIDDEMEGTHQRRVISNRNKRVKFNQKVE